MVIQLIKIYQNISDFSNQISQILVIQQNQIICALGLKFTLQTFSSNFLYKAHAPRLFP
jgi:hypothetical protein